MSMHGNKFCVGLYMINLLHMPLYKLNSCAHLIRKLLFYVICKFDLDSECQKMLHRRVIDLVCVQEHVFSI